MDDAGSAVGTPTVRSRVESAATPPGGSVLAAAVVDSRNIVGIWFARLLVIAGLVGFILALILLEPKAYGWALLVATFVIWGVILLPWRMPTILFEDGIQPPHMQTAIWARRDGKTKLEWSEITDLIASTEGDRIVSISFVGSRAEEYLITVGDSSGVDQPMARKIVEAWNNGRGARVRPEP